MRRTVFEPLTQFLAETGADEIWVACSGGLDSMALLALVRDFASERAFSLGVIHLNHNLRSESAADELFVVSEALKADLPLVLGQARNLRAETLKSVHSLETVARNCRYAFFQRLLESRKNALVVTAHNADDQVETMMMNLMRGTGLRGVKGIPQRRGRIGRPLLEVTRARLSSYVAEHKIPYREDPSNNSLEFSRNRVRHELLPIIKSLGGAGVEERIAGAGLRLAADLKIIDRKIDELWRDVNYVNGGIKVSRRLLQQRETEFLPHFLGCMIRRAGAQKQVSARVLDELVKLVGGLGESRQSHYDLGFGLIFKALPEVVFIGHKRALTNPHILVPEYQIVLLDYGLCHLPYGLGEFRLDSPVPPETINYLEKGRVSDRDGATLTEIIDGDKLEFPLTLRNRRPGDRFQPLGLKGRSLKLKKFLNARALSLHERSGKPLLCNRSGEIIWVVGERLDHRFRITRESRKIVKLTYLPSSFLPWE
ncbi:MAG: tRNA lysidine(34) synthetase TilS [Deltaproteobacteria bacterium]|nr:tRNA lysidine(34) synthetase TilS [Deltaproteobacteria bacterium]